VIRLFVILLFLICWKNSAFTQEVEKGLHRLINEVKLEETKYLQRNHPSAEYDEWNAIETRVSSFKKIKAFVEMQDIIRTSWRQLNSKINEFAPEPVDKTIFFKAAQVLPREEYIQFLIEVSYTLEQNNIALQQFKWALLSNDSPHLLNMWEEEKGTKKLHNLAYRAKTVLSGTEFASDLLLNDRMLPIGSSEKYNYLMADEKASDKNFSNGKLGADDKISIQPKIYFHINNYKAKYIIGIVLLFVSIVSISVIIYVNYKKKSK